MISRVLDHIDATIEPSLERLFELLRIPSISTQPDHAGDCKRAAEWLRADLAGMGFEASVRATPGHPIVVAHARSAPSGPRVLFYGHYDVQPVDPVSLWHTAPFEPTLRTDPSSGRKTIVGRGASDDKGQVMTFLEACRALLAVTGTLPLNVRSSWKARRKAAARTCCRSCRPMPKSSAAIRRWSATLAWPRTAFPPSPRCCVAWSARRS